MALLGALVGGAELISRYRDAPARALYNWPAVIYIALNLSASLVALAIIRIYDWKFGITGGDGAVSDTLFTVHAGDRGIGVGPGSFLQIFREASDRAVDRLRAKARGDQVSKLMTGIEYHKASEGLPPYCLALMQNVPDEEQVKLTQSLTLLDQGRDRPNIKVLILGLQLWDCN